MNNPQKEEIKAQFLEEAQDYINILESGLLGISRNTFNRENIDQILRAAHSLKGGAAMMEFGILSDFAHRLEDFLKILKIGKVSANENIENLFLVSVDSLGEVVNNYRQKKTLDSTWLETQVEPVFTQLHQYLGDLKIEDEEILLTQNTGIDDDDMSIFLFETEVEEGLTRLEDLVSQNNYDSFEQEMTNFLQELAGLAEMLDLSPLSQLCASIEATLSQKSQPLVTIAKSALQLLRRSQALVLSKQTKLLPTQLTLEEEVPSEIAIEEINQAENVSLDFDNPLENEPEIESFSEDLNIANNVANILEAFNPEDIPEISQTNPTIEGELENREIELEKQQDIHEPIIDEIDKANDILKSSTTIKTTENKPPSSPDINQETIRVSQLQIEELGNLFGELTIERNGLDLQLKNFRNLLNNLRYKISNLEKNNFQLRKLYDQISTPSRQTSTTKISNNNYQQNLLYPTEFFDLLEMDNYNDFHLLAGEMMETIVQIREISSDLDIHLGDAETIQRELTRTSKKMQTNLTQMRMRPLSDLLQRFPRALRQMEIEYGKQVDLQIKGGATLLEKNVLESLKDPLLHLFRNAFDHGIETPEIRQQLGKSPQGKIQISATYRGNQTVITIQDDGKGIDIDKIITKAQGMGLTTEDLANVTEKELLDLIFEPGFSTSAKVTDLSGRGVGMDVVKRNIEKIGGEIEVQTKPGMGTTFILSVPLTLSVVRVLLVESNKMLFAFPSNLVDEVELLEAESIVKNDGLEFIQQEEEMIRLIRLSQWFQFNYLQPSLEIDAVPIINQPALLMIERGNDLVALEVDGYWGEQEVTIRQIEGNLPTPEGFSGCTILGDGRVVPLIDTVELLNWIFQQNSSSTSVTADSPQPQLTLDGEMKEDDNSTNYDLSTDTIMVVDDSINVRRFLALTLEKANYHVEQAKDGQDGLEKLQSGIPIKAVVCDIEMPRLDGYGFLAHVKNDVKYQKIPVIMLTSRSSEKHRKLAINLGANAYFSKPFPEKELLQTIQTLLNK